jgi:hypothetical protein
MEREFRLKIQKGAFNSEGPDVPFWSPLMQRGRHQRKNLYLGATASKMQPRVRMRAPR